VEWTSDQETQARDIVTRQAQESVLDEHKQEVLQQDPSMHWDAFYTLNQTKFFKDRKWLPIEFPELYVPTTEHSKRVVFEIGCGVGNTIFPLLDTNTDPHLMVYGSDFSSTAIDLVKASGKYDETRCKAFVWDVTNPSLPEQVLPGSVDVIVLIFVLSALKPQDRQQAIHHIHTLLKPGGVVLFRDYGRYDLAQLRFKPKRLLSDNFYMRGDSTLVYFFTTEEIAQLFGAFDIQQNTVDRRLLVNRQRQLKMYRQWLQGKFIKSLQIQ
jgi:tRNAThr (cytosine32-N3)-methyltransferase